MTKIKTQGGSFVPTEPFVYFIANNQHGMIRTSHINKYQLMGVNEIKSDEQMDELIRFCESGGKLFIDSGIFNLTMTHARKFDTSMDEALALAPEEIDGFDKLFDKYCRTIDKLGDHCWGYTELDQGGRENKIRMRAKLEGMGYRPMPVYHPLNDGPEYFDYLAERYDRFAFGNLVQAPPSIRVRLMATQWERKRKYPDLWIHYLGVTASTLTLAFPANSCDSSSWHGASRWGVQTETAMCRAVGNLEAGLYPSRLESASVDAEAQEGFAESVRAQYDKTIIVEAIKARLLTDTHRDIQQSMHFALYGVHR